jgi:hypothetical protein
VAIERNEKGQILPGSGGRQKGSQNKLQADFLAALQKDFSENGVGTIRIVRAERPADYLRLIASVLPKEFWMGEGPVSELSDAELAQVIEFARKKSVA